MGSPGFLADFDSSSALVRALAAALNDRPFLHLGQNRLAGAAARATAYLPTGLAAKAFSIGGAFEAIRPQSLRRVSAQRFAEWAVSGYPRNPVGTVLVGSSNGAAMHLAAALRAPWLPQTLLVPVRRHAPVEDCGADLRLGRENVPALLERETDLQVHQMHDPNQDRLMLERLAYFRMKLRALPPAYRLFVRSVLPPGGTIVIVDCTLRWPALRLGERHVFQPGAVGGLQPQDYLSRWDYPDPDEMSSESEWGLERALVDDVLRFARLDGYRVLRVSFPAPDALGPAVADAHRDWYAGQGHAVERLLVETFISVEPFWALATRTVPLWTTFPIQDSVGSASAYLDGGPEWREIAVTLFAHGTRSEGLAPVEDWQRLAGRAKERGWLAGVDPARWPVDLATLDRYASVLHETHHAALLPRRPMPWALAAAALERDPAVTCEELA